MKYASLSSKTVPHLTPTAGLYLHYAHRPLQLINPADDGFDHGLVNNRLFGGLVRDWRAGLGFTARAKTIAIAAIIATFTISVVFVVEPTLVRAALIIFAAALVVYITRLPTKRPVPEPV